MIEISSGKQSLQLATPALGASGVFGFAGEAARLIDLSRLGAIVTNPVTLKPRFAAAGTRVVALDSGVLVHTGLPNPGVHKVFRLYAARWKSSPAPIIVHLAATSPNELAECIEVLDGREGVSALEIGLGDQATHRDVRLMIKAAREKTHLPLLAKLPLYNAADLAAPAEDAGANALVLTAAPRGTARDPLSGQMIGGRLYGPWLKALGLRVVGQVAGRVHIPVIGCGGIHDPNDARDYIEAGAIAVQVDTVAWVRPKMVETIARNLAGLEVTRRSGAMADEWWPGMGETAVLRAQLLPSPPPIALPDDLPE